MNSVYSVYGVKRTIVVGSHAAAEMVAKRQGGVVVQLYTAGCSLPKQRIKRMYEDENGRCRTVTVTRTVQHVMARGPLSGGMSGEATIGGHVYMLECYGMDAEDKLMWYARRTKGEKP